jgi:hypothetical protein
MQTAQGNKMTAFNTSRTKRIAPSKQSLGVLALLSMLIAVPAFLTIRLLEPGLILPVLSIVFFSYAAIVALSAHSIQAERNSEQVTLWDLVGVFTMTGCAAAIFSEPDQVAKFFEQLAEQHLDAPL